MYLIAILCLTIFSVTTADHEIHKLMSDQEVEQFFLSNRQNVPKYRHVNVVVPDISKRDTEGKREIRIEDGDDVTNLVLTPSDGILIGEDTTITWAFKFGESVAYMNETGAMKRFAKVLTSLNDGGNFILGKNRNGGYTLDGYLPSKNIVIRSLPEKYSSESNVHQHVIFEPQNLELLPEHRSIVKQVTEAKESKLRKTRAIPDTVWIKVLVVLDSTIYSASGNSLNSILIYQLILWNQIDLKFSSLTEPKIKFHIPRFVIALSPKATPYLTVGNDGLNCIHDHYATDAALSHFYGRTVDFSFFNYDVMMIFTRHNFCYNNEKVLGYVKPALLCKETLTPTNFINLAFVQDSNTHFSVPPAEALGQILGAPDRGHKCEGNTDFVVKADFNATPNNWKMSNCFMTRIRRSLASVDTTCVENKPHIEGENLPYILTSKNLDLNAQCQNIFKTESCDIENTPEDDKCVALYCKNKNGVCERRDRNPLDGTPCGDGKKSCMQGKCIDTFFIKKATPPKKNPDPTSTQKFTQMLSRGWNCIFGNC